MRTKGSATELEARRRRAAEYFHARKPLPEIADLVGVHVSSVKRWKRAWEDGGVKALAAKPHPGPAPKLSAKQKEQLVALLTAGPLAAGYRTDLWTCGRVAEVVRKNVPGDVPPRPPRSHPARLWASRRRSRCAWPASRMPRPSSAGARRIGRGSKKGSPQRRQHRFYRRIGLSACSR